MPSVSSQAAADPTAAARPPGWQQRLARAERRPERLLRHLATPAPADLLLEPDLSGFAMRVPEAFAQGITPGDAQDPLLRQVLPRLDELAVVPGYGNDPVGDRAARVAPGILRKYRGRALLLVTSACPIHCRYCFRRNHDHDPPLMNARAMDAALATLARESDLDEVILSGGDPLMATDARLVPLLQALAALPWLKRLRIHTRMPLVVPERITDALLVALRDFPRPVTVVLHSNHAAELGEDQRRVVALLRRHEVLLLNQSVLLRGVNDRLESLVALSERLHELGVQPYYLHQLDPVAGAAHFAVSDQRARHLIQGMRQRLAGHLVPRLVREKPGCDSKTPIG